MRKTCMFICFLGLKIICFGQCTPPESFKTATLSYIRLQTNNFRFLYKVTTECNAAPTVNDLFITPLMGTVDPVEFSWKLDSVKKVTDLLDPCIVLPSAPCHLTSYYHCDVQIRSYGPNGYMAVTTNCCRPYTNANLFYNSVNFCFTEAVSGIGYCDVCNPCLGDVENGIVSYIKIPPLVTQNSSAQFTSNDTLLLVCKDRSFSYQLHADDADNDSIAYHFSAPRTFSIYYYNRDYFVREKLPLSEIGFKTGYSAKQPAGPDVAINERTGFLNGTIKDTGTYVLTVSALEYRDGALLDSTVQDLIVKVLDCSVLPKPNASIPEVINNCNDYNIAFPNNSTPLYKDVNWNNTTFQWDFGDGDTSHEVFPKHTYRDTGIYNTRLIVFPGLYCADTAYTKTLVYPSLKASFTYNNNCAGQPVFFNNTSLSTSGKINYTNWEFKKDSVPVFTTSGYSPLVVFKDAPQTYTAVLTVANDKGCMTTDTQYVNIFQGPYPLAFHDTILSEGATLQLKADDGNYNNGGQFIWSPSYGLSDPFAPDPVLKSTISNTYYVTIKNSHECERKDSVRVRYYNGPDIYVPTAFTPNSDGKNDIFRPFPVGISTFQYFRIYNRLGQLVFQTNQSFKGWDGNIKGTQATPGIYVWEVSGIDYKGKTIKKNGTVVLLR